MMGTTGRHEYLGDTAGDRIPPAVQQEPHEGSVHADPGLRQGDMVLIHSLKGREELNDRMRGSYPV